MSFSSSSIRSPSCQIDSDILNENSIEDMRDIALSFFASACGKNRGAFVLDPPDGHTYGCLVLPKDVAELAGIEPNENVTLADANSINANYLDGNITSLETISLLDFLVGRVYESTPSKESNLYACDVNGLAKLSCGGGDDGDNDEQKTKISTRTRRSPRSDGEPIRSVTLAGLLLPDDAPWTTKGKGEEVDGIVKQEVLYTLQDFQEMKSMGLNTVQISVPTSTFTPNDAVGGRRKQVLVKALQDMKTAGLQAILSLVATTGDELDAVESAAKFSVAGNANLDSDNSNAVVLALTLPKEMTIDTKTIIDSVRAKVGPELALFVPLGVDDLVTGSETGTADDPNIYGSLDWSHTSTVADIASSSSQDDRSKMFYHESVACTMRSPIEHSACFGNSGGGLPIFWSSGFDLSVDNCARRSQDSTTTSNSFKDYGQCDRFDETIESGWWQRHRESFAARQMFAAEQGLGWSFAAWKLYDSNNENDSDSDTTTTTNTGLIDEPAKLLSLRDVMKAGLFPDLLSLSTTTSTSLFPAQIACLNPPENDFVLGDDTLAPTMGPPPDCGDGWWNSTTSHCDYWIPPPEPTMSPTVSQHSTTALTMAALGGAVAVLVLGFLHKKLIVQNRRRSEYSSIPH